MCDISYNDRYINNKMKLIIDIIMDYHHAQSEAKHVIYMKDMNSKTERLFFQNNSLCLNNVG